MELDGDANGPAPAYLTFELGGEGYAVAIADVDQIIAIAGVRSVPAAPGYVVGIMDYDDSVISVIDLADKLGVTGAQPERRCILVVRAHGERVGLIVDGVRDVVRFGPGDVESLPRAGATSAEDSTWSQGVAQARDKLWLLLNIEPILSTADVTPLSSSTVN